MTPFRHPPWDLEAEVLHIGASGAATSLPCLMMYSLSVQHSEEDELEELELEEGVVALADALAEVAIPVFALARWKHTLHKES